MHVSRDGSYMLLTIMLHASRLTEAESGQLGVWLVTLQSMLAWQPASQGFICIWMAADCDMNDGAHLCHTHGEGGPVQEGGKHRINSILDQDRNAPVQHCVLCSGRPAITCALPVSCLCASMVLIPVRRWHLRLQLLGHMHLCHLQRVGPHAR